jgi:hypothetical protein
MMMMASEPTGEVDAMADRALTVKAMFADDPAI